MIIPVATLALATHLAVTSADNGVPTFNVEQLCRGIAHQGGLDLEPNETFQQSLKSCVTGEIALRQKLVEQWQSFSAIDRANCTDESSAGGVQATPSCSHACKWDG